MRKINNLDIGLIRTFVTIVNQGGYAQASQVLNLSESAVSHQMRRLEDQLGALLFQRKGRIKELTSVGEVFLSYATRILAINDELYERVGSLARDNEIVHFGLPEYFTDRILAGLLAEFSKKFPRVDFRTQVRGNFALTRDIRNEILDFALVIGNTEDPNFSYHYRILADELLLWFGQVLELEPGQPLPLIAFEAPCTFRNAMIETLNQQNINWHIAYTARNLSDLKAAVKAGLGVSALPKMKDDLPLLDGHCLGLPKLPSLSVRILFPYAKVSEQVEQLVSIVDQIWHNH